MKHLRFHENSSDKTNIRHVNLNIHSHINGYEFTPKNIISFSLVIIISFPVHSQFTMRI